MGISSSDAAKITDLIALHSNPSLSHELCNRYAQNEGVGAHELTTVTGYRRIPGDFCVGGAAKAGKLYSCSAPLIAMDHWWLSMLIIAGLCCLGWLGRKWMDGPAPAGYRRALTD